MTTLRLLSTGDIDIRNGEQFFVSGIDELGQSLNVQLNTASTDIDPDTKEVLPGAWAFDNLLGARHMTMLRTRPYSPSLVKALLSQAVKRVLGVKRILSITLSFDADALSIDAVADILSEDDEELALAVSIAA